MTNETRISSLSEYMAWVKDASKEKDVNLKQLTLLYRGHANKKWQLQPSVYRTDSEGKSYRAHEYDLYQQMLRRSPDAFEKDKTVFERLIRMQHNGLPTRLLDLTENPLVALFFACENEWHNDGEIFLFSPQRDSILYPHAIPDASFCGVENKIQFNELSSRSVNSLIEFFTAEEKNSCEYSLVDSEYTQLLDLCISKLSTIHPTVEINDFVSLAYIFQFIHDKIIAFVQRWECDEIYAGNELDREACLKIKIFVLEFNRRFNEMQKVIIEVLSDLIGLKNGLTNNLDYFMRQFVFFNIAYSQMNNERVKRQQGLFLIWPPMENRNWGIEKVCAPIRVTINSQAKKEILDDLTSLGITRSYLYPELAEQAMDIKKLYPVN
ncbi:FRG domain-containing protein [Salmonella enterica]|nr:FRG domain-containing protein [Salmonella enterica]EIY6650845.1 FRG domain-containing protein [Salmonella enterica]